MIPRAKNNYTTLKNIFDDGDGEKIRQKYSQKKSMYETDCARTVEAKDFVTDAGRPARLDLVQMSEKIQPGATSTVVELSLGQNAEDGALARVDIPQDGKPQIDELKNRKLGVE